MFSIFKRVKGGAQSSLQPEFHCKMCGGVIPYKEGDSIGKCVNCGSVQTLPHLSPERTALFERAHYARRNRFYGRAMKAYDALVKDDEKDPESYWGRILVKYRVWYKQNEATFARDLRIKKRQFANLSKDPDYQTVLKLADDEQRPIYEKEAADIVREQKHARRTVLFSALGVAALAIVIMVLTIVVPAVRRAGAYKRYDALFDGLEVGDTFTFGVFEQDRDPYDGYEPIEWLVLDKNETQLFVVSKIGLVWEPYNQIMACVTWPTCSARKYLNGTFFRTAFDKEERSIIDKSDVYVDKSIDILEGPTVQDHVFLLNVEEVRTYLPENEWAIPSSFYADAKGAFKDPDNGNCWWWLRSPGHYEYNAAVIYADGKLSQSGRTVTDDDCVLRPAMRINLKKDH